MSRSDVEFSICNAILMLMVPKFSGFLISDFWIGNVESRVSFVMRKTVNSSLSLQNITSTYLDLFIAFLIEYEI